MRLIAPLAMALLLAGCATIDGGPPLPQLRYAGGGSYTDASAMLDAPPTPAVFEASVRNWTEAIGDSSACRLPQGQVSQAGLIAAAELAFMGASARTGERRGEAADMARYAADMALASAGYDRRPSRGRCARLSRWLPEVNRQGSAILRRSLTGGLRDLLRTRP